MPTLPQENTHAQALNTSSPYQYRPFSPAQLPPSSPLHDRLRHQPCCSTPGVMPFCSNTAVFPSLTILCVAPKTTGTAPAEVIRPPKCQLLASLGSPQGATWREATPPNGPLAWVSLAGSSYSTQPGVVHRDSLYCHLSLIHSVK